jgi:hypothetical protein
MDKKKPFFWSLVALALLMLMMTPAAAAVTKKVLFYEVQASTNMRITGSSNYTRFNALLQGAGYSTAGISSSDVKLTQEKLADYDVVIMQGLNKALDTEEILALRWYGAEPDGVNNLGQIYGILMDKPATWLVDTANFPYNTSSPEALTMPAADQKYYALIREFPDKTDAQGLRMSDVHQIAVYKTHPLFVESVRVNSPIGKTKVIATGSSLSYTETGTFPVGSQPPVAARAFFGAGAVVVFSDFNMLQNAHIFERDFKNETIDNDKFGLAAINWLANKDNRELSVQNESELAVKVLQLQSQNINLDDANRTLFREKQSLLANISQTVGSYETMLATQKTAMQKQVTRCEGDLTECNTSGLKKIAIGAGIGFAIALVIFAYLIIAPKFRKGKPKPAEKNKKGGETQKAAAPEPEKKKADEHQRQEKLDEVKDDAP